MNKECLLGIDMGTSSVKAGLFDLKGEPIAFADATYPLYTPRSGWAEQKAEDWWNAVCTATRALMEKSGADPACDHRYERGYHVLHGADGGRAYEYPASGNHVDGRARFKAG